MKYKSIKWGIIGCGDVCEVKSGPAFNNVRNSELIAVMRRDIEKAKDYAQRHKVNEFYDDADKIIHHKKINAVYIATPPAFHEQYAIESMKAGKMVYIEKPIALNANSCKKMIEVSEKYNVKASGAYYRRALPLFIKVKSLVKKNAIGNIRLINIKFFQSENDNIIANTEENWRIIPELSGGGLFHDLAPHQLDIVSWIFGPPKHMFGCSMNQTEIYNAPDITSFEAILENNIYLQGIWLFNVDKNSNIDICEIIGDKGKIEFSFFRDPVLKTIINGKTSEISFQYPEHIQQPMIEKVVNFFIGKTKNPCSLEDALVSMKMLDSTII